MSRVILRRLLFGLIVSAALVGCSSGQPQSSPQRIPVSDGVIVFDLPRGFNVVHDVVEQAPPSVTAIGISGAGSSELSVSITVLSAASMGGPYELNGEEGQKSLELLARVARGSGQQIETESLVQGDARDELILISKSTWSGEYHQQAWISYHSGPYLGVIGGGEQLSGQEQQSLFQTIVSTIWFEASGSATGSSRPSSQSPRPAAPDQ